MAKIGVITYDFFPLIGGIGRHTHLLHQVLADRDILFFSPAGNSLPRHVRIRFRLIQLLKQAGVTLWLHLHARRIISGYRLGLLNVHSGAGGVLLVRRLPVPVVVTCHHTYWQHVAHLPSQFWKRIFLPFEKRTYALADRVVAVSEDTKQVLIGRYGVPAEKIEVIHNTVDEKFRPLGKPKDPHTILYVGRIDRRKGIDFLLESLPLVRERVPDVRLLVAGKGKFAGKMKTLVRQLGLEGNVTFLGFVPEEELNSLYNSAQCAVVPSVFEGFGISVIEALAAGTRVVGTDVDGIRSTVTSGDYGRLVPYGDILALADALVEELRNQRTPQELGREFRLEQFTKRYTEVLGKTENC